MFIADLDGFNLHAAVRIEADDGEGRERLVRYCARPCFALDRLRVLPDHLGWRAVPVRPRVRDPANDELGRVGASSAAE